MQNEKVFNITLSDIRNFTVKILNYPISTSLSLLLSLQTIIMIAVARLSIRMVSIINVATLSFYADWICPIERTDR